MKKGCLISLISLAVLVVLVLISGFMIQRTYNDIVAKEQEVNQQWAQVENVYQRRADLIPNLVATVKGYAAHEADVLETVTASRAQAGSIRLSPDMLKNRPFHDFEIEWKTNVVDPQKNNKEYVPNCEDSQYQSEKAELSQRTAPPDKCVQHQEKTTCNQRNHAQEEEVFHRSLFLHYVKIPRVNQCLCEVPGNDLMTDGCPVHISRLIGTIAAD